MLRNVPALRGMKGAKALLLLACATILLNFQGTTAFSIAPSLPPPLSNAAACARPTSRGRKTIMMGGYETFVAPVRVVGGVSVRGDRVFMAQRPDHKTFPGRWEFPGGKVEEGETDEQALERELLEELGVKAKVGFLVGSGKHGNVELFCYRVDLEGEPKLIEHQKMDWIKLSELKGIFVPPADETTVEALVKYAHVFQEAAST